MRISHPPPDNERLEKRSFSRYAKDNKNLELALVFLLSRADRRNGVSSLSLYACFEGGEIMYLPRLMVKLGRGLGKVWGMWYN